MSGEIIVGTQLTSDRTIDCDVCIVGSGAGGAVLAAGLAERGHDVVMLEEGPYLQKEDFDLQEGTAYPAMYQDRGTRATTDLAITILQGRVVGGGTTVNWTTSFRTPPRILEAWASRHGVTGWSADELAPHFAAIEERLNIHEWPEDRANPNNRVLLEGARRLGYEVESLRRNVRDCGNTGYCGVGCPLDAKQGMAITYIPDAIEHGMRLYADARAERFVVEGDRVTEVECAVLSRFDGRPTGTTLRVRPRIAVSSCGAINGPALLLRSGLDRNGRVGKRTMLHPVCALPAIYPHPIFGFTGAPQSIGSHHFIDRGPDRVGFFLETPPLQPMLAASGSTAFGAMQQETMSQLQNLGVLIAIHVDGLVDGDEGGTVSLCDDGRIAVDYPIGPHLIEAFAASHEAMARIELAAGARYAISTHIEPVRVTREGDLARLAAAPYGALEHAIFTAHQMGGCAMGEDRDTSVVSSELRHHHVQNLFVVDGSVFPTALGVNPSNTIYAMAHRARDFVADAL